VQSKRQLRLVSEKEPVATDVPSLFRAYGRYIASIALRVLGRDDEVDDVVQEVFIFAMSGAAAVRDAGAIRRWLAVVTVRVASQRLRRRRLRSFFGMDDYVYEQVAAPGASPEDHVLLNTVYEVLDRLPTPLRVAWSLRHAEGMELQAVADACECSLATAKRRIAAAHEAIQKVVGDE
jgi:RNA polymerase sigma-70 factor (ECF subfamily)